MQHAQSSSKSMQSASNSGYVVLKVSQTEFGILPDISFEYKDSEVNFFSLENSDGTVPDKKLWSSFNPPVFFLESIDSFSNSNQIQQ